MLPHKLDNAPTSPRDLTILGVSLCIYGQLMVEAELKRNNHLEIGMDKKQVKARAHEAKGKAREVAGKASGDKTTENKGKIEKHGGKAGAVLADVNRDAKKATKQTGKAPK